MKNIIVCIFCLSTISCFAQQQIKVEDASNHVGEVVKICTKVYGGKYFERDSLTLLNAGAAYPDAPLTIVIRAQARKQFNNPEDNLKNANVCVTGKIELYKDKPQIEVMSKEQLVEQLNDHTDNDPK